LSSIVRNKKVQRASSLTINDQNSVKVFCENVTLLNFKKRKKLEEYFELKRRELKRTFSKVKSIKEIGNKEVYDIEVENSHEFNCEGIKIHNCDCYKPNDLKKPDLMHDEDVYSRLENNDGFIVFSPIHWHAPTTQVKALFDRLVCANMTLTTTDALSVLGKGNLKNSEITGRMSLEGEYDDLLENHLEGKVGGFYIHGDMGADDYSSSEKPETFNQKDENKWFGDAKSTIMPIVFQCRYSGIEVPDKLVQAFYTNKGEPYYQSNIEFDENKDFFDKADELMENLLEHLEKKES
jgi:multimeric flavodoxin WrbA